MQLQCRCVSGSGGVLIPAIRIRKVAAPHWQKHFDAKRETLGANNDIEDQNLCSGTSATRTDTFVKLDTVCTILTTCVLRSPQGVRDWTVLFDAQMTAGILLDHYCNSLSFDKAKCHLCHDKVQLEPSRVLQDLYAQAVRQVQHGNRLDL